MSEDPGRPVTGPGGPPATAADKADGGLRARAARGVVWAAAEKWLVRASTLVGFVILGRLLEPAEFGVVALAMVFITLLTVVTEGGFGIFLVQRPTIDRTVATTTFVVSAGLGLVLAPALALAAPLLADLLDTPALAQVLPALAVALLVASLSVVPASLLQRDLRFRDLAVRQVVATGLSVVVAVVLAFAGAGVWALVAQTLVRSVVAFAVLWWMSDFRPAWTFSRPAAREMLGFGSKSLGIDLLRRVRDEGEAFLVGVLLGTTALGYWTVALRLVTVVVDLFSAVLGRVASPVFARVREDVPRLGRALGSSMAIAGFVMVPVLVVLALTSEHVVPWVFGSQWVPATGVAAVLAFRAVAYALGDFPRVALVVTGAPGAELAVTLGQVCGQVVVLLLVADRGLVAIALALTGWAVLTWPVRALLLHRLHGIGAGTYRQVALVVVCAALAAGAVLGAEAVLDLDGAPYVALAVVGGGAVYLGTAALLCRPTLREIRAALPVGRRRGRG